MDRPSTMYGYTRQGYSVSYRNVYVCVHVCLISTILLHFVLCDTLSFSCFETYTVYVFVIVDEYFCDSVRMLVNQVRIHRIAMFRNVAACRSNLINWAGENDSLIHQYFLLKKNCFEDDLEWRERRQNIGCCSVSADCSVFNVQSP